MKGGREGRKKKKGKKWKKGTKKRGKKQSIQGTEMTPNISTAISNARRSRKAFQTLRENLANLKFSMWLRYQSSVDRIKTTQYKQGL